MMNNQDLLRIAMSQSAEDLGCKPDDFQSLYLPEWSNLRSVRNAYKCSFVPTWVEMTVKPIDKIEEINKKEN